MSAAAAAATATAESASASVTLNVIVVWIDEKFRVKVPSSTLVGEVISKACAHWRLEEGAPVEYALRTQSNQLLSAKSEIGKCALGGARVWLQPKLVGLVRLGVRLNDSDEPSTITIKLASDTVTASELVALAAKKLAANGNALSNAVEFAIFAKAHERFLAPDEPIAPNVGAEGQNLTLRRRMCSLNVRVILGASSAASSSSTTTSTTNVDTIRMPSHATVRAAIVKIAALHEIDFQRLGEFGLFIAKLPLDTSRQLSSYRLRDTDVLDFRPLADFRLPTDLARDEDVYLTVESVAHSARKVVKFRKTDTVLEAAEQFGEKVSNGLDRQAFALARPDGSWLPRDSQLGEFKFAPLDRVLYLEFIDIGRRTLLFDALDTATLQIEARSKVFGVPPHTLPMGVDGQYRVPLPLIQLKRAFLARDGLGTEGVFRVPGNEAKLMALIAKMDDPSFDCSNASPDNGAHEFAVLIKRFFGDMRLSVSSMRIAVIEAAASSQAAALALLLKLPRDEQALICYWLDLLALCVEHRAATRMTSATLATVVGPNLCSLTRFKDPLTALTVAQQWVALMEMWINLRVRGIGPTDFSNAFTEPVAAAPSTTTAASGAKGAKLTAALDDIELTLGMLSS
jgi:hypothetical protein